MGLDVYVLILTLVTLTVLKSSAAQAPNTLQTAGTKFVVYPSRLDSLWDRVTLYITTSSPDVTQVRIYTPMRPTHKGGVDMMLTVTRDHPAVREVKAGFSSFNLDKLHDGIVVISSDVISVFVNNPSSNASGVTSILTYDSLGTEYLFPSTMRTFDAQTSILIGNPDGLNEIKVTLPPGPSGPTLLWRNTRYGPGQSFVIRMNKDEFADIRQQDGTGSGDLTGTRIQSQQRVAVFSAAVFYPQLLGDPLLWQLEGNKDIIIENIPPLRSWGKTFVVTATPAKSRGDYIRVLAGSANTKVLFSNGSDLTLSRMGDFFQREIQPGASFTLRANRPIHVIQYRYQFLEDSAPFMFHVPAVESYGVSYTVPVIFSDTPSEHAENYVVLVTHACFADRVIIKHNLDPSTLQTVSLVSSWKRVNNSSYVTTEVKVDKGFVTVAVLASDSPEDDKLVTVGGFFFGMGPKQAYAAPLGLRWVSGNPVMQWKLPTLPRTRSKEPITAAEASLVSRDTRPLTLPLSVSLVRSRVACHHQCWKDHRCFFVAYQARRRRDGKDGTAAATTADAAEAAAAGATYSVTCFLLGPTAACSGHAADPGYVVYALDDAESAN